MNCTSLLSVLSLLLLLPSLALADPPNLAVGQRPDAPKVVLVRIKAEDVLSTKAAALKGIDDLKALVQNGSKASAALEALRNSPEFQQAAEQYKRKKEEEQAKKDKEEAEKALAAAKTNNIIKLSPQVPEIEGYGALQFVLPNTLDPSKNVVTFESTADNIQIKKKGPNTFGASLVGAG